MNVEESIVAVQRDPSGLPPQTDRRNSAQQDNPIVRRFTFLVWVAFGVIVGTATLMAWNVVAPEQAIAQQGISTFAFTLPGAVFLFLCLLPTVSAWLAIIAWPARVAGARSMSAASWLLGGGLVVLLATSLVDRIMSGGSLYTLTSTARDTTLPLPVVMLFFAAALVLTAGAMTVAIGLLVALPRLLHRGESTQPAPILAWSLFIVSIILVLFTPILFATLLLPFMERWVGSMMAFRAGEFTPLLSQQTAWKYSPTAAHLLLIPGLGVTAEIVRRRAGGTLLAQRFVVPALGALAVLVFLATAYAMFSPHDTEYLSLSFSILGIGAEALIGGIILLLLATVWRSRIVGSTLGWELIGFLSIAGTAIAVGLFGQTVTHQLRLRELCAASVHLDAILGGLLLVFIAALGEWGILRATGWPWRVLSAGCVVGLYGLLVPRILLCLTGAPHAYWVSFDELAPYWFATRAGAVVLCLSYILAFLPKRILRHSER